MPTSEPEKLQFPDGWTLEQGRAVRELHFSSFQAAIRFVNQVAEIAEALGHHPDLHIVYDLVTVSLTSHDEGGLTRRDVELAAAIDAIVFSH